MRISDWSSDVCSSDLARNIRAAVIIAVEDGHVLLVEQYRVPLGCNCLELPAGLVGDHEDGEADDPLAAAGRELEEETEIGRASCRESVVSVRVDLGGRRCIKKKKNKRVKLTQK